MLPKEHMSPQLSLQHHYIIHKYQSQIKSAERGLQQPESTKGWSIYGTQSPWQLQICPAISQEGEQSKSAVPGSCGQAELQRGCREHSRPRAQPGLAGAEHRHLCWPWAGGAEEMALEHLGAGLLLLQHPCPAQELLLHRPSWPRLAQDNTAQKNSPKPKCSISPHQPVAVTEKRSKGKAGGEAALHPGQHSPAWAALSRRFTFSDWAPSGAKMCPCASSEPCGSAQCSPRAAQLQAGQQPR